MYHLVLVSLQHEVKAVFIQYLFLSQMMQISYAFEKKFVLKFPRVSCCFTSFFSPSLKQRFDVKNVWCPIYLYDDESIIRYFDE